MTPQEFMANVVFKEPQTRIFMMRHYFGEDPPDSYADEIGNADAWEKNEGTCLPEDIDGWSQEQWAERMRLIMYPALPMPRDAVKCEEFYLYGGQIRYAIFTLLGNDKYIFTNITNL